MLFLKIYFYIKELILGILSLLHVLEFELFIVIKLLRFLCQHLKSPVVLIMCSLYSVLIKLDAWLKNGDDSIFVEFTMSTRIYVLNLPFMYWLAPHKHTP